MADHGWILLRMKNLHALGAFSAVAEQAVLSSNAARHPVSGFPRAVIRHSPVGKWSHLPRRSLSLTFFNT